MTKEEIIEMAMEAEFVSRGKSSEEESELFVCIDKDIYKLANLVAAKAIKEALAQPEQEPVAWGVFDDNLHDMFFAKEEAQEMVRLKGDGSTVKPLYTHTPTVQLEKEPIEYWNAVEGWVKIDEVREHFGSVGCGTIYKTAGEDRTPLYTAPPQIEVGCAECGVGNHHALYCVACAEKFVGEAATKLQQKQETIEGLNRDYDLLFAEHQLLLKKEWVGLSDEERQDIALEVPIDAVFITEAVLKDKNTRRQE